MREIEMIHKDRRIITQLNLTQKCVFEERNFS